MASSLKPDIELLFGVLGGGSVGGDSGKQIKKDLDSIIKSINSKPLKVKIEPQMSGDKRKQHSEMQARLNEISNASNGFYVKISQIKLTDSAISRFKKQLQNILNAVGMKNGATITIGAPEIGEIQGKAEQMVKWVDQYKSALDGLSDKLKKIQAEIRNTKPDQGDKETADRVKELTEEYDRLSAKLKEVRGLKEAPPEGTVEALERETEALQENAEALHKSVADEQAHVEAIKNKNDAYQKSTKTLTAATGLLEKYSAAEHSSNETTRKAYDSLRQKIDAVNAAREALLHAGNETDANVRATNNLRAAEEDLKNAMNNVTNAAKESGDAHRTLGQRISSLAEKFTTWFTLTRVIMATVRSVKQMVTAVREIDTAMTELRKVTNETETTYRRFLSDSADQAKNLGASISDVVNATADFARLGFGLGDASKLAEAAIVYKNVGDGIENIGDASESIISTMQAFGIAAEDAMSIVDKFNAVGNNYAISSKGVGEALLRSASAMKAAGNTLDETIALAAAANTIIQNPQSVGTTLKTISMFLRSAKVELEEAGESTEGIVDSVSKLRANILGLTGGKVDIQIDDDTFKSTTQILRELSQVWKELSDVSRASILEMIGGKRNANVTSALLENFELVDRVIQTSMNSAGSAMEENEKVLNSIEGHISRFKASFQELSETLINSEFVKQIIDLGTGLLNFGTKLAEVIDKLGGLPSVLTAIATAIVAINARAIIGNITKIGTAIGGFMSRLAGIPAALGNVTTILSHLPTVFAQITAQAGLAVPIFAAVTAAIGGAILIYQKYKRDQEESRRAREDEYESFRKLKDQTKEYADRIQELKDKLEDSNTSQADAYQARVDLLNIRQELIEFYGDEASSIDLIGESADESAKKIRDLNDAMTASNAVDALTRNKQAYAKAVGQMMSDRTYYGAIAEEMVPYVTELLNQYDFASLRQIEERGANGKPTGKIYYQIQVDADDADQAKERLTKLNEELFQLHNNLNAKGIQNSLDTALRPAINAIDKVIETYSGDFQQYIQYSLAAVDENRAVYSDLIAKTQEYQKVIADTSLSEEERAKALTELQKEMANFDLSPISDEAVKNYISDLVGKLQKELDKQSLRVDLTNKSGRDRYDWLTRGLSGLRDQSGNVSPDAIYAAGAEKLDGKNTQAARSFTLLERAAKEYGLTIDELVTQLTELGLIQGEVAEKSETVFPEITKAANSIDAISSFKDALDALAKAYGDLLEENSKGLSYESIEAIGQKFSDVEGIDNYIKRLLEVRTDAKAVADVMDELANAYALTEAQAELLAGADEQVVAAMLKEAGAAESDQAALYLVEVAKAKIVTASLTSKEAVDQFIAELANETGASDTARAALIALAAQMIATGNTGMDFSAQIAAMYALGDAADINMSRIRNLQAALLNEASLDDSGHISVDDQKARARAQKNYKKSGYDSPEAYLLAEAQKELSKKAKATKPSYDWASVAPVSVGGGSSGGGGGSSVEEYIADIDKYYEATKRLEEIQQRMNELESNVNTADTNEEKIFYTKALISAYDDQAEATQRLIDLRKESIQAGVEELRQLGFQVEYNEEANRFLVQNMGHLNELSAGSTEATNKLRQDTEGLINSLEELNKANQEGANSMRQMTQEMKQARKAVFDYLRAIVEESSGVVDTIQKVSDTLHKAADEFASSGFITVDTFQEIVSLGTEYMAYLQDENGMLVINEENINRVLAAKTQELAVNEALAYVERIRMALEAGSVEELNHLLYATMETTDATWGLVYANLALLGLDDDQYQAALNNINAIRSLADSAVSSIGRTVGELQRVETESLERMKRGVDDILKYVMDMLKQRIQEQIDALNDMKQAYADLIAMRKESIQTAKEETDYQASLAEKVREIAALQQRINALSLDNSRSATAERMKLEEELAKLQGDLADQQAEHSIEAQENALDSMQKAYEEQKDEEIKVLEDSISSYQKLYDMA